MNLIDLYKRDIFKKVGKTVDSFSNENADGFTLNKTIGSPTNIKLDKIVATPKSSDPLPESTIKRMAEEYYDNAPLLQAYYLGRHAEPLVYIKPNESKDQYSTKLDYTNTRREATVNWLKSTPGVKFLATQVALQLVNPTLESKLYNPLSVLSNTIPFVDYHERRHMTVDSLFGLPTNFILGSVPATYTEAIWTTDFKSRNFNQSPQSDSAIRTDTLAGVDYAFKGVDYMMKPSTWNSINPNRYLYPVGPDGAGLPISNRLTPGEERQRNIGLAAQGYRFTQGTGFNPVLDAQITMDAQSGGTSFLQQLLKNIPYANTILSFFGYGVIDRTNEIKYYSSYNATYRYAAPNGKIIFVYDRKTNKELDPYNLKTDNETPIERLLWAIEQGTEIARETPRQGVTFLNEERLKDLSRSTFETTDKRVTINPQDGTSKTNSYLQAFGGIIQKRTKDKTGTIDIDSLTGLAADNIRKPYTAYIREMIDGGGDSEGVKPEKQVERGMRIIHSARGYGFARPGARNPEDRTGDLVNQIPYGEDLEKDPQGTVRDFTDLIPFKFYHINERKWIVFRANLTGITDNITPTWGGKKYIGRADQVYIYSGAERSINFSFSIVPYSPKELKLLYEKLNYLIGLNYPRYIGLSNRAGNYMEAPFVKLTIGDLFKDVPGIMQGGLTITIDDEATWEVRQEQPQPATELEKIQLAKLPRLIRVSVNGFTPFGLENKPISSTSPFYSAIQKWQEESETTETTEATSI